MAPKALPKNVPKEYAFIGPKLWPKLQEAISYGFDIRKARDDGMTLSNLPFVEKEKVLNAFLKSKRKSGSSSSSTTGKVPVRDVPESSVARKEKPRKQKPTGVFMWEPASLIGVDGDPGKFAALPHGKSAVLLSFKPPASPCMISKMLIMLKVDATADLVVPYAGITGIDHAGDLAADRYSVMVVNSRYPTMKLLEADDKISYRFTFDEPVSSDLFSRIRFIVTTANVAKTKSWLYCQCWYKCRINKTPVEKGGRVMAVRFDAGAV
ncbi:p29 [Japanese holly fern mottle virus]|uniref:p29 n=1 Tax=Japanese holly fern mottle virus TaxID=659660 RepID=C7T501_9VIRU|nr:p29 [Japanese holly fern mottle virus]